MDIIANIFSNPEFDGSLVEYYPHVNIQYETGGTIVNEDLDKLKINLKLRKTEKCTEYIYREKHLTVYDEEREYQNIQQQKSFINNGLIVISKVENIDPNKFPVLNNYYDIIKKTVQTYDDKYITFTITSEEDGITYTKISFTVVQNDTYKKKILRHLKAIISSLS